MPTSVLRRFIEQQRLLWSNRIGGVDYYNLGLSDPRLPMEMKRSYIGRFQSWRVFCAFNPAEHHHLVDRKLEFNEVATKAGLPVSKTLAVVTQDQSARSEEHTSELQSLMRISYAVFCLKKKIFTIDSP